MKQLGLFSEPTAPSLDLSTERELAKKVPEHVRFGTSSWTFPGWAGLVYAGKPSEKDLIEKGLAEYAKHPLFRTVGIDRSYYAPLADADLERYARDLPRGFTCVIKAWSALTTESDPRTGRLPPTYLDVETFERDVAGPLRRVFADHVGALVLEFPPRRITSPNAARSFAADLDRFFGRIGKDLPLAVEIRNRELLSPAYLDVLAKHRVAHVLNWWERMPDVGEQLAFPGILTANFAITRLLIRPGTRYEERRKGMFPFNAIVDESEKMRADVVDLARVCAATKRVLFVIVNNKAEGSSPLTVRALAERLANVDARRSAR